MEEFKTEPLTHEELLRKAISFATNNIQESGGPFGALIASNGVIIATGCNRVTADHDPTAHAEVNAIREACKKLGTFNLSGCDIYTSCEPCPMCLSAIYWARIDRIYYGCCKEDAKNIGFDDSFIYEQIELKPEERSIPSTQILHKEALSAFRMWEEKDDKIEY